MSNLPRVPHPRPVLATPGTQQQNLALAGPRSILIRNIAIPLGYQKRAFKQLLVQTFYSMPRAFEALDITNSGAVSVTDFITATVHIDRGTDQTHNMKLNQTEGGAVSSKITSNNNNYSRLSQDSNKLSLLQSAEDARHVFHLFRGRKMGKVHLTPDDFQINQDEWARYQSSKLKLSYSNYRSKMREHKMNSMSTNQNNSSSKEIIQKNLNTGLRVTNPKILPDGLGYVLFPGGIHLQKWKIGGDLKELVSKNIALSEEISIKNSLLDSVVTRCEELKAELDNLKGSYYGELNEKNKELEFFLEQALSELKYRELAEQNKLQAEVLKKEYNNNNNKLQNQAQNSASKNSEHTEKAKDVLLKQIVNCCEKNSQLLSSHKDFMSALYRRLDAAGVNSGGNMNSGSAQGPGSLFYAEAPDNQNDNDYQNQDLSSTRLMDKFKKQGYELPASLTTSGDKLNNLPASSSQSKSLQTQQLSKLPLGKVQELSSEDHDESTVFFPKDDYSGTVAENDEAMSANLYKFNPQNRNTNLNQDQVQTQNHKSTVKVVPNKSEPSNTKNDNSATAVENLRPTSTSNDNHQPAPISASNLEFLDVSADESVLDLGFTGTIQLDKVITISAIESGGWAEKSGLRNGDMLFQIDGNFVTDLKSSEVRDGLTRRPIEMVFMRR